MKSLEHKKIILIGASTGGPAHIEKILCALRSPLDATLIIAQHMGADFLPSFVKRLALKSNHPIYLAQDKEKIQDASIYIVSHNCEIVQERDTLSFQVTQRQDAHFNPDINHLFFSAVPLSNTYSFLAILLTGIGDDGVNGCSALAQKSVKCIAESEKTSIVYGIPARAKERVENIIVRDLDDIIIEIQNFGEHNARLAF